MTLRRSEAQLTHATVARWRANPAGAVTQLFGITPDPWQVEALEALRDMDRVSVRACHGPGKSAIASWMMIVHMLTRFPSRVPCTAPTGHQLSDILWSELAKWHQAMPASLRVLFNHTSERFSWSAAPLESFAVARTSRPEQPEGLQGFHGANLLFVIDEASGVPDKVFEVAAGALSGEGAKVAMFANPTRASGYFFDSHHKMRHLWHTMSVSHADSARVTDAYVAEMAENYGVDSNVYRVRVLGDFPLEDDDSVISFELAEAALTRDITTDLGTPMVWGLDVARFGDDASALVTRRGPRVVEQHVWRKADLMVTAGRVYDLYHDRAEIYRPKMIYIDSIGLGAGVLDRLRELGLPVQGVNVAEAPSVKPRFMRLRDELWFEAREWFEERQCRIEGDHADALVGELTMPKYSMTSSGKILVEPKDQMKKRGTKSPDLADALCLTFQRGSQRSVKSQKLNYAWSKAVV